MEDCKNIFFYIFTACHHQHSNQLRLQQQNSTNNAAVCLQYKEPQRPMRSLKSRLMPRRQSSQHKLYTTAKEISSTNSTSSSLRGSLRRSTTVAPSSMQPNQRSEQPKNSMADPKYLVKRLAHYSSMADALVGGGGGSIGATLQKKTLQNSKSSKNSSDLNVSDKENKTPDQQNYR